MKFTPINEKDAAEAMAGYLLQPGEADFKVLNAEDLVASTGREMIKLTLDVTDANGKRASVFDNLMHGIPFLDARFRHFAFSCGLGHKYTSGELVADDAFDKSGRLVIRIEKGNGGFKPKNVVADYVIADHTKATAGYQTAKAKDGGQKLPESPSRAGAWKAFRAKTAQLEGTEQNRLWFACIEQFFGHRDQEKIEPAQWAKFGADLKTSWTPNGGWPHTMRAKQAVESPIGDETEFKEADIPF